jgi:hypothetical protein
MQNNGAVADRRYRDTYLIMQGLALPDTYATPGTSGIHAGLGITGEGRKTATQPAP